MDRTNDTVRLCGTLAGRPVYSHTGRDGVYMTFPLAVERLSGAEDVLNILVPASTLEGLEPEAAPRLLVTGEVRSWNNRSGRGPRLVISVLARSLTLTDGPFENSVRLTGTLCRAPSLRRTPMGREISDMMLAVSRPGPGSDYIPCIAWGAVARAAAGWEVGTRLTLTGRLQSRAYVKLTDEGAVPRTAYELSCATAERTEGLL